MWHNMAFAYTRQKRITLLKGGKRKRDRDTERQSHTERTNFLI